MHPFSFLLIIHVFEFISLYVILNPHASTAMIGFNLSKLLFGMFASKNKGY